MEKITVTKLAQQVQTEADAYRFMESLRWPDGQIICPHCGVIGEHYFLTPKASEGRKTRTGTVSERRVWKCRDCRKQFSVITGTVMHGSKASLRIWLFVIFEMCANKNGIAAREIERKYGVASRTAWFMTNRLREAMKRGAPDKFIGSIVVSDETWIGGEPRFMHAERRVDSKQGKTAKVPVLSLIDETTGEVRSQVVPDVSAKTLRKVMNEQIEMTRTTFHTDGAQVYKHLAPEMAAHLFVDHTAGQYVLNGVSTNQAENYFSQLKRSLDGTHHHVSREHLPRYLAEFDFRYSTRHLSDTARVDRLMGQVAGRRLRYQ